MNFWLLLNSGKGDAAFNMALDEALLENAARLGRPAMRFYGWTEPAATFGYFQKFSEVERATPLRPLIRRPTGGGIVPHDADWTYSFVAPPGHEWHSLKAEESYRRIHEWIQSAFAELNIETELAQAQKSAPRTSHSALPSACFTGHEKFDLLRRKKKIAGAAQRRNKLGLLIQGSIQPPAWKSEARGQKSKRADWEAAMIAVAENQFCVAWRRFLPDAKLVEDTAKLAEEKYSQAGYNRKR